MTVPGHSSMLFACFVDEQLNLFQTTEFRQLCWPFQSENLMGYYMRYIVTDDQPLLLGDLDAALKSIDPNYAITNGDFHYGSDLYGEIEINPRGEELCDEELSELEEFAEDSEGAHKQRVIDTLCGAKAILAVRVLWQGRESEPTLKKNHPLWEWLFSNRQGLMAPATTIPQG